MNDKVSTLARVVNGWQMNTDTMGVCGVSSLPDSCLIPEGHRERNFAASDATWPNPFQSLRYLAFRVGSTIGQRTRMRMRMINPTIATTITMTTTLGR